MDQADFHYYEPSKGHGLRHNPFNAIIAPRPIGWISSRNALQMTSRLVSLPLDTE